MAGQSEGPPCCPHAAPGCVRTMVRSTMPLYASTSCPVPARGARRCTVVLALAFILVAKLSSLQRAQ